MSRTFIDTSALLAVLKDADPDHDTAVAGLEAAIRERDAFTHNYVAIEAEQLVRRRLGAAAARRLLEEILPAIETIWVDQHVHEEAVAAVAGKGRAASLVDETSFLVMRNAGVVTALAFDADFERAGYRLPDVSARQTLSETAEPYGTPYEATGLVSVSELAARSGRSVNTIQSWRRRHPDFPAPNVELAAGPIWLWSDVSAWIDRRSQRSSAAARR
jgi:predicted nucleic acid-binding protein